MPPQLEFYLCVLIKLVNQTMTFISKSETFKWKPTIHAVCLWNEIQIWKLEMQKCLFNDNIISFFLILRKILEKKLEIFCPKHFSYTKTTIRCNAYFWYPNLSNRSRWASLDYLFYTTGIHLFSNELMTYRVGTRKHINVYWPIWAVTYPIGELSSSNYSNGGYLDPTVSIEDETIYQWDEG